MTDGYKFLGGVWTAANIEDSSIKPQGQKLVIRQIVIKLSANCKGTVFLQEARLNVRRKSVVNCVTKIEIF